MPSILTPLVLFAGIGPLLSAELPSVAPFVGTHHESFEVFTGNVTPCLGARVFDDGGDVCSLDGSSSIGVGLSSGSTCTTHAPEGQRMLVAAQTSGVVFTLDAPATRFGAFFSNYISGSALDLRFYDAAGALVGTGSLGVPSDCTWVWGGWSSPAAPFQRIEIENDALQGGGFAMDNAWADLGAPPLGSPYCFCDGTGTPSPCGNDGYLGAGCAHLWSEWGSRLRASGVPSVSASTLSLQADYLTIVGPGVFFQANETVGGGQGLAFGDGLICAQGNPVRLEVVSWQDSFSAQTSVDLSAASGNLVAPGETKAYQFWFRSNSNAPCNGSFNFTNGLRITWQP